MEKSELDILKIADKGTRFRGHLADFLIYLVIHIIYVFIMEAIFGELNEGEFSRQIGGLMLYFTYYIGSEFLFSKTLGKYITKTKVVNQDGTKPKLIMLIIRNVCRWIPFDQLSYLFDKRGWHDQISQTYVVEE